MSTSMYRAYISMVIVFRTYVLQDFFQVSTMSLSCFLTGRRKAILLFGNRISCIIIYVMNNLVNPRAWWQCSMKITVLFVGRCSPGKFHQVDSASAAGSLRRVTFMSCAQNVKIICFSVRTYFRSFDAETYLLKVELNRNLYR